MSDLHKSLRNLSFFESHEYVKNWYKEAHKRDAGSQKISQVNACFLQGRELSENAASADMSVKPLLLYYSVLSFSRGAILLNDPTKKEESLKPSHGLQVVDWQGTLSKGLKHVFDVEIKSHGNGTFQELVKACWNLSEMKSFVGATTQIGSNGRDLGQIRFASDGSRLTLGDLLSRIESIAQTYNKTSGKAHQTSHARIASFKSDLHVAFPFFGVPEQLRKLADEGPVTLGSSQHSCPGFRQGLEVRDTLIFSRDDLAEFERVLPLSSYGSGDFMTVVTDFPNGDRLNMFFRLYLLSYILGMLVRYFPSTWMNIISGGVGDTARPAIFQAVEVVSNRFPEEVEKQLTGIVKPQK